MIILSGVTFTFVFYNCLFSLFINKCAFHFDDVGKTAVFQELPLKSHFWYNSTADVFEIHREGFRLPASCHSDVKQVKADS